MDNIARGAMPSDARVIFDVSGDLASQDDFSGALCDGQARRSQCAGGGRRRLEMESGATAQTGDGQHQAVERCLSLISWLPQQRQTLT